MATPGPWTWDGRQKKWIPTSSPSSSLPVRTWWVPAEGIVRAIIQSQIQGHLGPESTCRPYTRDGVPGYSINATRTFTAGQIRDLQHASAEYAHTYGFPDVRTLQELDRMSYPDKYAQQEQASLASIDPAPTHRAGSRSPDPSSDKEDDDDEEEEMDSPQDTQPVDKKSKLPYTGQPVSACQGTYAAYQVVGSEPEKARHGISTPLRNDVYGRPINNQGQLVDCLGRRVDEYYRLLDRHGGVVVDAYGNQSQGARPKQESRKEAPKEDEEEEPIEEKSVGPKADFRATAIVSA